MATGNLRIVASVLQEQNPNEGERQIPSRVMHTFRVPGGVPGNQSAPERERMASEAEKSERQSQVVIPLHAEELSVTRRQVVTGRTRISRVTRDQEARVEVPLTREAVEIERRPVGARVSSVPPVRQEGDTIIIPVVEEQLVVERRLVLKEEVRVRRIRNIETHQERVITRKQDVTITRLPAQEP